MKVQAINDRGGYRGHMEDEATYNRVRNGEVDWKPHIKAKIEHYTVPANVFERLLALDRQVNGIVVEVATEQATEGSSDTAPIKTDELCMRCVSCETNHCEACSKHLQGRSGRMASTGEPTGCVCLTVPIGEPCKYYKELKGD